MRASIVISSHNEGGRLWKTVRSCLESSPELGCEIIVADDASTDGSLEALREHYPDIPVVSHPERLGVSPTKDLGARHARGEVLLFIDGHCKPELGTIARLVDDVRELDGRAIVMPRVPALDPDRWQGNYRAVGYGFRLRLLDFDCGWLKRKELRQKDRFYVAPMLVGCCLAVSKATYERLQGFDPHMLQYGLEDLDFGLKAWLMGYEILVDPFATIGHKFRETFDNYSVALEQHTVNQLRMARKNFTEPVWREWLERLRSRHDAERWPAIWELFESRRQSLERERDFLMEHRVRDEYWYAREFALDWPQPSCKSS